MADAAEKITVSYSSRTCAFLPAQVAVAKGFFEDENLDPVLIQMRSQVTVPTLLSGEVNYTLSFGNIIAGVKTDKIIPLSQVGTFLCSEKYKRNCACDAGSGKSP